jgi:hypothetical protein
MPTVHDLRYTAYSGRAGNLWRLGMHEAALQDRRSRNEAGQPRRHLALALHAAALPPESRTADEQLQLLQSWQAAVIIPATRRSSRPVTG